MEAPQGFEKFEAKRGGRGESFNLPYLHISKWGIYINRATVKEIGNEYRFAVLYYDRQRDIIGVWFWKDAVIGAYRIVSSKYPESWHITAGQFLKEYNVLDKVRKSGKDYFPFTQNRTNKEFYVAEIK